MKKTQKQPLVDVFGKKLFFKISQSLRQSTGVGVFLNKVAGFQPAYLWGKKKTPAQVFSCSFEKFLQI